MIHMKCPFFALIKKKTRMLSAAILLSSLRLIWSGVFVSTIRYNSSDRPVCFLFIFFIFFFLRLLSFLAVSDLICAFSVLLPSHLRW